MSNRTEENNIFDRARDEHFAKKIAETNISGRKREVVVFERIREEKSQNVLQNQRREKLNAQTFTIGETSEERRRRLQAG